MTSLRNKTLLPLSAVCLMLMLPRVSNAAQMQMQAKRAAEGPMKLDVRPLAPSARVDGKVVIEVSLRDAANQPAVWKRPSQIEVEVTGPSGKVEKKILTIPAGQSAIQFTCDAFEPGLLSLKARETNDTLLPGGNSVFVTRVDAGRKSRRVRPNKFHVRERPLFLTVGTSSLRTPVTLVPAHWSEQGPSRTPEAVGSSSPELLLSNSSGKEEILADGSDFARLQVYFMEPDGESAPSDIKVWLTWSNGDLVPNPLIIKKGAIVAEAHLTSRSPVVATVSVVTSAPKYAVNGRREFKVEFVPPIYGIGVSGANPLALSLIDCEPLVAQFFDDKGRTVQSGKPRRVTFISSNSALHIEPSARDVQPSESGASIFLLPTWRGRSRLDIWTPGYDHQTLVVDVSMWLVLLLCLVGGVVGGIAAKETLKGSVVWRIFVGILGAIVLVWFCVYAVLPQTHSIVAHNLVSVFVIGIVGGHLGTRVFDFAGKKLGVI